MYKQFLQRRYLVSFESRRIPHIFTDVLVIGAGAAGISAALAAADHGQVIVLAKGAPFDSNTYHAQGGLAAVMDNSDSVDSHVADSLTTASGLGDPEVIRSIVAAAPQCVAQLVNLGVEFDTQGDRLSLGREGGHSANRIVHAHGDATGMAIATSLVEAMSGSEDVKAFDNCFVLDILTDPPEGGESASCVGALTYHSRYGMQIIRARQTILAAGGAGMLWRETSNPASATGDAMAMAFRAGVALSDVEMMQFHPTTLYIAGASRSLISEAVRGEGAKLVDRNGNRFMDDYHEMAELAPRDIVSRAILDHMAKTGATHVFLDVRHIGAEAFFKRFPHIYDKCRSFDIDPAKDLMPVHPAAHYMIGGVRVDAAGRSSLDGLLACGEASCTGLHGANRLASNSLIEALVCGGRCGETAGKLLTCENARNHARSIDWAAPISDRTELDLTDIRNSLRSVMWRNAGIVRNGPRLAETMEIIGFWGRYVLDKEFFDDPSGWEIQNMLTAAYLVAQCASLRTESRGVHYRSDYPQTDPAWQRHQTVRRTPEKLIIE